jgi:uncharacterized coiled-coil protein SlyX
MSTKGTPLSSQLIATEQLVDTLQARIAELETTVTNQSDWLAGWQKCEQRVSKQALENNQLRAELAGLKSEIADLESDLEQITDHNIELQFELAAIKAPKELCHVCNNAGSFEVCGDMTLCNMCNSEGRTIYAATVAKPSEIAAKMPCGATVSDVYAAYAAGLAAKPQVVMPEREAFELEAGRIFADWDIGRDLNRGAESNSWNGDGYYQALTHLVFELWKVARLNAVQAEVKV